MKSALTAAESGWRVAASGLKPLRLPRAQTTDCTRTPQGSPLTNSLMTKWSMSGVSLLVLMKILLLTGKIEKILTGKKIGV